MQHEQQIDHVVSVSVTEIDEIPFGAGRFLRTLKVRMLLGEEFALRLRSESRLALVVDADPRQAHWPEGLDIPPGSDSPGESAG